MVRVLCFLILASLAQGCSSFKMAEKKETFGLLGLFSDPFEFSQWHFDSFELCDADEEHIEYIPLPSLSVWDRLREGFQISQPLNKRIQQELNWYAKHPSYMARVSERASKYLFYIVDEVERRGIPMELALLPIVESAFDPFAYSHGQASGMWQVVPGTGRMLGLKQNWWYDGRRDVTASTHAALNYLESLYKQMDGDWLLALASYNSGAGNVNRAIRKNKKLGKSTDYWSLDLPKETEAYVPRLMAIKALVEAPDVFAVDLFEIPNEPFFVEIDVASQIDLAQAADLAEMSMDDFYSLNPAFNRWATDPDGPHTLLVPAATAPNFQSRIAAIPEEQRVTWHRYKIRSGDTLSEIAKKYNTTVASLEDINSLNGQPIRAGKTLLVPQASANASHYTYSLPQRVKRKQSKGKGNKIHYVVQNGDSLWTISRQYGVSTSQLARWNAMAPSDTLRLGQKLVVWTKTASNQSSKTVRKVAYRVKRGDSLAAIANRFNLRIKDILSWNQVNPKKYLQPGDRLTLFIDVTEINSI